MKKVITCGTYDLPHRGHINLLKRAKAMGDDWDGKFDHLREHCQVVYLPRTDGVSTTRTKAHLRLTESSNVEFSE